MAVAAVACSSAATGPGSLPDHDDWPWLAGAFPGHRGTPLATSAGLCRGSQIPHVLGISWRSLARIKSNLESFLAII